MGHTWPKYGYLMRPEEPDQCLICGEALTVKHVILHHYNYEATKTSLNIPKYFKKALGLVQENINKII